MHIPSRFSLHKQECNRRERSSWSDGGGRCEGHENTGLSAQKEAGRGMFSGDNHYGNLDIQDVIDAFEDITGHDFYFFRMQKRANSSTITLKYLYASLARHLRFSYPQIGRSLQRDHSTVVHYINRHNLLMEKDENYLQRYKDLIYYAELLLVK